PCDRPSFPPRRSSDLDRLSNHPLLAGADAQALAPVNLAVGAEHAPQALDILPVDVDVAGTGSAENLDLGGSAEAAESTHRESSVDRKSTRLNSSHVKI